MIDLDDEPAVRAADPGDMLTAVAALADHCRAGYAAGKNSTDLPDAEGITGVAFCGMGGSAVAGDVARSLFAERLGVPVQVVRSPVLPEWCGPHALVLICSYSGNTAEAISCFEEAIRRGCRIVAITSGGELGARVTGQELGRTPVPSGFQPRAAVGFLSLGALGALEAMGVLPLMSPDLDEAAAELEALSATLAPEVPTVDNLAKRIALAASDRVPVVWGAEGIASVAAMRWKTQFNENAKVPAFASSMSELDHNEVVGWSEGSGERFVVFALRHDGEHPQLSSRFPLSVEIARDAGARTEEVWAHGRSGLARLLTLVMVGDHASTYLAIVRGVDPTPVDAIERLKLALAKG